MNQPLAFVHPQAKIANNVVIEPYVVIHKNVEIGEGSWIGSHTTIMEGARIGKNCKIFPGAVISAPPQDLKYNGEDTIAKIGDNTTIREFVTVNKGTKASGETIVGNDCLIMAYAHIAHDCIIGNNVILANCTTLGGHVEIDDWAIIGGLSAIHQFVKIGTHCILAGGSFVNKDIPPFIKAARYPISFIGVNSIGLRRRDFSAEKINEIQNIYRILYLKGNNVTMAVRLLETELPATKERDKILLFISNSDSGIMKGYLRGNYNK